MKTDDHELMRMIRKRVNAGYPMTMIADELGQSVDELCAWIMEYKEPRRERYVNRQSPAQIITLPGTVERDWHREAERFKAWKRQHDGAAATLREKA